MLKERDCQSLDSEGSIELSPAPPGNRLLQKDVTIRAAIMYLKSGKPNNISLLTWVR